MPIRKQEKALIGERLRDARERARIPVAEAAEAANVQPLAVEKWERGAALPNLLELRALLMLYGVTACQVLYENSPLELSPEQTGELARHAKHFSPGLRSKVDVLLAMIARAKEPVWRTSRL